MKAKKCMAMLALVLAFGMVVVGCEGIAQDEEGGGKKNPVALTADEWTRGEIVHPDSGGTGEQWFEFVASESTQHVYIKLSTITYLNARLYDSNFDQVGSTLNVQGSGTVGNAMWQLSKGETYYIQVSGEYYGSCYSGAYQIGFTGFPAQPETVVTELSPDAWENGNIVHPDSDGAGEQWFSFTATGSTQHIFIRLNSMTYLNAYLYDSDLYQVGDGLNVQGSGKLGTASWSVRSGETYYVKVSGMYFGEYRYSGTYRIAFNGTGEEPL